MPVLHSISFLLNREPISLTAAAPGRLLLDYLRRDLRKVGTKEGCREGDCGACGVLIGELGASGQVTYRAVPSCMVLLGHLQGRHVVTIEGINLGEGLSPVQSAVVEHGASQCGFCTPGFIVSFTGFLLNATEFTVEEATTAIAGNLCRCTGYVSLVRAGASIAKQFDKLTPPGSKRIETLLAAGALSSTFADVATRLRELPPGKSACSDSALLIGGGTDLIVQRGAALDDAVPTIHFPSEEQRKLRLDGDTLRIPAAATFEDLLRSDLFTGLWPNAKADLDRFASALIRERATVAGNIANASPIADGTAIFLALEATLEIDSPSNPNGSRTLPLSQFFLGYKQLALTSGERITSICIPHSQSQLRKFSFEKVSKREFLDIATVNTALSSVVHEGVFSEVILSAGGVGPTPMLLIKTAESLRGEKVAPAALLAAAAVLDTEIAPISDVRGSADYKRLLLRQLFFAHFLTLYPDQITEVSLLEVSR